MDFSNKILTLIKGPCLLNEPMAKHTTYGIGGPAMCYAKPQNVDEIKKILIFSFNNKIPIYFVGSGSNLLVSDGGIDGIVVSLSSTLKNIHFINNTTIYSEAGVMLGKLVKLCIKHNLTGTEGLIGVPGTLGGALIMNAGAFGGEISKFLLSVETLTLNGKKKLYKNNEINFQYRSSSFSVNEIIIGATFQFKKDSSENIKRKKEKASFGRKSTQPLRNRSAGSVFKNPNDNAAGYLIDQSGLKGAKIGGAEISEKHANFFINTGNASSSDMASLIKLARKKVKEKFGISLELEIKTIGFPEGYFNV